MNTPTRARLWLLTLWGIAFLVLLPQPACARQSGQAQSEPEDGKAALRSGQYDQAIAIFGKEVSANPQDRDAQQGLVDALIAVGRYEDAEQAARSAEGALGAEMANTLGEVLVLRGKLPEAEQSFRRAVQESVADRLQAELNLAVLLHDRGEHAEARRHFDTFIDVYNRSERLSSEQLTAIGTAVRYLGADNPQLFKDAVKAYDEAIAADPTNPEPRVLLSELFLEKYNSADARATFQEVLGINPSHPRALLGMAQTHYFEGSPQATEFTRQSLAVNPNFVPAHVFQARLRLDLEDYEGAAREAEQALATNPVSLPALAVLAATRYLQGDRAGWEAARQRALALNPAYAELYVTAAESAVRHRKYVESVELARQAVALDSQSWNGWGALGLNQLRIGQIDDATRSLETSFAGDPYNVWVKNTLDLLDTFERYESRSTEHFQLFLRGDEAGVLFPYAAELAEQAYAQLSERYGYRPDTPIRVEVYPSHADFSVRTVGLAGLGALGVSFGNVLAMDSPSARERGHFNWGSTLWHEITHTVTLGLSDHQVPRWFTEGLSVREERRARPGWGDDVSLPFLVTFAQGQLLPISQLNNGFVRPDRPEQIAFSYYQASLVVELIEQEYGWDAVLKMLRGYRDGKTTEQLFREVLGTDLPSFDRRFNAFLRQRFAVPLAAFGSGGGATTFLAQLTQGRQLLNQGQLDAAEAQLQRAKATFPDYAAPDAPRVLLTALYEQRAVTSGERPMSWPSTPPAMRTTTTRI